MLNVTITLPGCGLVSVQPFPADIDAWRRLLGGSIDLVDCSGTKCPCAVVMRFQSTSVISNSTANEIAGDLLGQPVFGCAALVTGASAVRLLDQQFEDWQGDDDEVRETGAR